MTIQEIALYSFFFIIISWGSKRVSFLPFLCLLLGMVWGFLGHHPRLEIIQLTAKIALVYFLFLDSSRLHFPKVLHYQSIRLPTIGFLITLILGIVLVQILFPFSIKESCFLLMPLLALDAKVSAPALASFVPPRISQMFNVEGSLTSIFAFFFLSIAYLHRPLHFFISIAAGVALGYISGFVGKVALKCGWATQAFFRGALILLPFAIFACCELFHSSGFIGVIAAGVTFGHSARLLCDTLFDFSRRQGLILFYLLIIFFGSQIVFIKVTVEMIVFALLFLFGVRFFAVFFSLIPKRFQWKTLFYFTFFAPKGLVPIAALFLFFSSENLMMNITLTTILCSLFLHSLFAYPIAHAYGQAMKKYPDTFERLPTIIFPT
jgi:NhaP-type Na+/H+ or K+/H+ antiporter